MSSNISTEIQIGTAFFHIGCSDILANDGTVYLVEPHPGHFAKLEKMFPKTKSINKNVHLVNYAICDYTGTNTFYIFNEEKARKYGIQPHVWMEGSCGFDPVRSDDLRNCGKRWLNLGLKMYDEIQVPCLSFTDFIEKYNISSADSIKIDTEGYDLDIIEQIDLDHLNVKKLKFEFFLAKGRDPKFYTTTMNRLERLGFKQIDAPWQDHILIRE
jgi:FkbM family methyltransferase